MSAGSDVSDAMTAVLGTSDDSAERRPATEVAEPGQGPCSKPEAEALVEKAIAAAETFYDTIVEIIRRQAWVPLGYANPRELMLRSLGGTAINPSTGRPYSRSHVNRMARVSWMLWAISERTGVDPGDLVIPERTLRELGGGQSADLDLVDTISDRVEASIKDRDASPDDVQSILDSALSEAAGGRPGSEGRSEGRSEGTSADSAEIDDDFDAPEPSRRPSFGAGEDDDFDDADDSPAGEGSAPPVSPALDAFGTPGDDKGFGDEAPVPTINRSDVLAQMRASATYQQHLEDIREIGSHLPEVATVKSELPEFLDSYDDEELEELKELLEQTRSFVDRAQKAKEAIDAVVAEAQERLDF